MDELQTYRDKVDELDKKLMELLGERYRLTQQVGTYKAKNNINARDIGREDAQTKRIAILAAENGVDPLFAQQLLGMIIENAVQGQQNIRDQLDSSDAS